jgi:hypothetical protein
MDLVKMTNNDKQDWMISYQIHLLLVDFPFSYFNAGTLSFIVLEFALKQIMTSEALREILRSCWHQDFQRLGVYYLYNGDTVIECDCYIIDSESIPQERLIPMKAIIPELDIQQEYLAYMKSNAQSI